MTDHPERTGEERCPTCGSAVRVVTGTKPYADGLYSAQAYIDTARWAALSAQGNIRGYGQGDYHRNRAADLLKGAVENLSEAMRHTNYELDDVRREADA